MRASRFRIRRVTGTRNACGGGRLTDPNAILWPAFALAGWTMCVLLSIAVLRVRAVRRGEARPEDFRLGESAAVPARVALHNRNYMNLLELPVLFYVVLLMLRVTGTADAAALVLAWAFVGLRIAHSVVHLTWNNVLHRLVAFAAGNCVLLAIWVRAGLQLAGP